MEVSLEFVVRSTDLDFNKHVNNTKYVEYLEWGRVQWYDAVGLTFEEVEKLGLLIATVNININYRRECRLGDRLRLVTKTEKMGTRSFVLKQELFNEAGELCADALVTSVFMDAKTRKSRELPEHVRKQFQTDRK